MSKAIKRMQRMRNCLNCRNAELVESDTQIQCDEIQVTIESLVLMQEPCSYWQQLEESEK